MGRTQRNKARTGKTDGKQKNKDSHSALMGPKKFSNLAQASFTLKHLNNNTDTQHSTLVSDRFIDKHARSHNRKNAS